MSAKQNGITRAEIAEIITHGRLLCRLAQGMGRLPHGKGSLGRRGGPNSRTAASSGLGAPNDAYAQYFVGHSYLKPLGSENGVSAANVTFEPGCRNNWHIHHASKGGGQILLCTAGRGWYQEWGKPAQALSAGDTVVIPPEVKHWHGAAKDSWFSHVALEVPGEGAGNELVRTGLGRGIRPPWLNRGRRPCQSNVKSS